MVRQYIQLTVRGLITALPETKLVNGLPKTNWSGPPVHKSVVGLEVPILFRVGREEPPYWLHARLPFPRYEAYAVLQSHVVRVPKYNAGWQSAYPGALFFFEPECIALRDEKQPVLSYSSFMHIFGFSVDDLEAWDGRVKVPGEPA